MSSCSLSQTRLSRSSLPGLDQATDRPLNGTRHRPRAHSHSHTPSLNVLSDWLSHRGAHTTACGPKCYSSRLAARTMITAAWPRGITLPFIGVFATDLVSRRFNTFRRRHRQRATLAPASSPRAHRARHESPLQPRARKPPAHHHWPWRAASVARPPVRADQRGVPISAENWGCYPAKVCWCLECRSWPFVLVLVLITMTRIFRIK